MTLVLVGFWGRVFALTEAVDDVTSPPTFAVDAESVPPEVFGLVSYSSPVGPAARVPRKLAIQCGAVKESRDKICGPLGRLPIDLIDPGRETQASPLFEQPERSVPRSVTMTRLFEDLLFEGIAWWRVAETDWRGYPTKVKRLKPSEVNVDDDQGVVYVNGRQVADRELIRFDSPNDPLLIAGARAIRTLLSLEGAAENRADGIPPVEYFRPAEGADPADDETIKQLLIDWREARRNGGTAYIPAALEYVANGFNPEQLQLGDQRDKAVVEVARHAGMDPEDLGVSTTSRTYQNGEERRKSKLDETLGSYLQAVVDRLSMGDVSPRGWKARPRLAAFLRTDTKTVYETYKLGLEVGAIEDENEVRELEDKPPLKRPLTRRTVGQVDDPTTQEETVNSSTLAADAVTGLRAVNFDSGPALALDASPSSAEFSVDADNRTIRGLAVPYGKVGVSNGQRFQFSKGTLKFADPKRVKLWVQHDKNQAIGFATKLEDREDGLYAVFQVARGAEGDRILALAEDGVLDGLSIGLGRGGRFRTQDGIQFAVDVPLMEISLTPAPSFDDSRVGTFSADDQGGADVVAQMGQVIGKALLQGFSSLDMTNPQGGPEQIAAAEGRFEIDEPSPYRFDGVKAEHSFVADMREAQQGNSEARQRLEEFGEAFAQFAVTTGNTGSLNPTRNRPDLYVPNLQFSRPLWESVSTGTVEDVTPFTVPKFSSAAGLVGNHTQGTEPTPGSFSATVQTITPAPMSGKIEINREVLDQGGSPQADQIIWGEMLNAYYEAIEAKIAAALKAVATAELNLASAVDSALVDALTAYFAGLQFVRGGNRFTRFVADGNLFPALIAAKDSTGRKLLPILGPANAQGTTDGSFDRVALGNQSIRAAWALGTGNDKVSFNFVPSSVWAWASAPKKFVFEYQVKSVDMAIWGYAATAVLRDSDVKPIDYTTADV